MVKNGNKIWLIFSDYCRITKYWNFNQIFNGNVYIKHSMTSFVDLPYQAFEYILYNQITLRHDYEQRNVGPCKQRKLFHVIFLHERKNEPYETDNVEAERYKSMIRHEDS